jgi:RNA polymerase sigma-70 factor, ECF subfamily
MFWKGGADTFERQVQKELPVLYRVARRMGASAEEAEDLVQTTLVKAYQAWSKFDGRHLKSWLIRILRNERLMNIRSGREYLALEDLGEDSAPVSESFWAEVSWRLEAGRILEELELLPEAYRMAIQLCDVEQMSYEEASQAMDVPIGTVRSRLFRARALLRERLAPMEGTLEGVMS